MYLVFHCAYVALYIECRPTVNTFAHILLLPNIVRKKTPRCQMPHNITHSHHTAWLVASSRSDMTLFFWYNFAVSNLEMSVARSHRLAVRTPGSHPGNRGSIPRGITMLSARAMSRAFCMVVATAIEALGVR